MLSRALNSYGDRITIDEISTLAAGLLTPSHAQQFVAFVK
jgi:hypothetical protein